MTTPLSPDDLRLLRSLSVQLPFQEAIWKTAADGLRVSEDHVRQSLERWQREGVVLGVLGEPNPASPGWREALLFSAVEPGAYLGDGNPVRWKARTPDGRWLASALFRGTPPPAAWPATEMTKAGLPVHLGEGAAALLQPQQNRSWQVQEQPPSSAPTVFETPRQFPLDGFWPWVGEQLGAPDGLAAARRLVGDKVFRRFALRLDFAALGMRGCGMATWKFDNPLQLPQAAAALLSPTGTADVAIRPTAGELPGNLTVLFVAWGADDGRQAAEAIARQWNLPLASWLPLELH